MIRKGIKSTIQDIRVPILNRITEYNFPVKPIEILESYVER